MHFEAATTGPVYQFEPGLTFQRCCDRGTAGKIGSSLLSSALATAHPPTTQNRPRPSPPVRASSCVSTGLDTEEAVRDGTRMCIGAIHVWRRGAGRAENTNGFWGANGSHLKSLWVGSVSQTLFLYVVTAGLYLKHLCLHHGAGTGSRVAGVPQSGDMH